MKSLSLKEQYSKTVRDDLEKGYIIEVEEHNPNCRTPREWYLPHHPVVNPHKPGKVVSSSELNARFVAFQTTHFCPISRHRRNVPSGWCTRAGPTISAVFVEGEPHRTGVSFSIHTACFRSKRFADMCELRIVEDSGRERNLISRGCSRCSAKLLYGRPFNFCTVGK